MDGKNQLAILGVVVALGIIISTYLVTDVIRDVRLSHQIIKVRGYAEKEVSSDMVVWGINVKTRTGDHRRLRRHREQPEGDYLLSARQRHQG